MESNIWVEGRSNTSW